MKYQKKPVEAIQWKCTKKSVDELKSLGVKIHNDNFDEENADTYNCVLMVELFNCPNRYLVQNGLLTFDNYIIKEPDGKFSIMEQDEFLKLYDPIK